MFKTIETADLLTHRYESLGAFIAHQEADVQYRTSGGRSWAGVANVEEACQLARKGLPAEGVRVLQGAGALTASAVREAQAVTLRSLFDVAGAYVDIGRYVENTPECMIDQTLELAPVINPVVTIVSNVTASCAVDADDMRQRGRVVVALIKAVETAGRATELWVDMTSQARSSEEDHYRISVRVKAASQPLDMGAVMYAFTHPSMMRMLCHNAMHSIPAGLQRKFGVGGGYARLEYRSVKVEQSYGAGAVYLPAIRYGGESPETTVTTVLDKLGLREVPASR